MSQLSRDIGFLRLVVAAFAQGAPCPVTRLACTGATEASGGFKVHTRIGDHSSGQPSGGIGAGVDANSALLHARRINDRMAVNNPNLIAARRGQKIRMPPSQHAFGLCTEWKGGAAAA